VITEVVAGARSTTRTTCGADVAWWPAALDAATDFDAAALIYRRCRQAGITPRGMIDCMIAVVAWRQGAALLCLDVDLERVAAVIGTGLDEASVRR
jgi:predicted nucleic acid-binding protein